MFARSFNGYTELQFMIKLWSPKDLLQNKVIRAWKMFYRAAAISLWLRLFLPSCSPGFESQAHHLHFFQFILLKLQLEWEKDENKRKRGRDWPIFFRKCYTRRPGFDSVPREKLSWKLRQVGTLDCVPWLVKTLSSQSEHSKQA